MSLILDALRRADSERERGSVPGLHAHPLPALPVEPEVRPPARTWQRAVIGLAAGVVVSLAWYFTRSEAPLQRVESLTAPAPAATPAATRAAAPAATRAAAPAAAPAATSPVASPAAPVSRAESAAGAPFAAPAAPAAARPSRPLPVAEPAPWPGDDRRRVASRSGATTAVPAETRESPARQASAVPTGATPASATQASAQAQMTANSPPLASPATLPGAANRGGSPAAPESPIYARDQLPPQIRSGLPPLAITGSIYSPRAADRTLIVNGRLLRENDQVGAGLLIEQIRQKSAVLRYRGYRFEVMF